MLSDVLRGCRDTWEGYGELCSSGGVHRLVRVNGVQVRGREQEGGGGGQVRGRVCGVGGGMRAGEGAGVWWGCNEGR